VHKTLTLTPETHPTVTPQNTARSPAATPPPPTLVVYASESRPPDALRDLRRSQDLLRSGEDLAGEDPLTPFFAGDLETDLSDLLLDLEARFRGDLAGDLEAERSLDAERSLETERSFFALDGDLDRSAGLLERDFLRDRERSFRSLDLERCLLLDLLARSRDLDRSLPL